ncbi:nucleoid-associated protein [Pseudomonas aeruginosa]|uniref:nucleoid-associated protein n=1 Tax=Pseudomonas aeruginosa TaxID=287 RepID=UPI00093582BC|nr:nucleoid-associated protein [Pseudomonas aeruginosa]
MPQITNCIVHKLIKDAHQREADVDLRPTELEVNPSVQRLIDHLDKLYTGRAGKGYGRFENNEDDYPMQRFIREHVVDEKLDFVALSERMMRHLKERASVEQLATGGFVLIAKISKENVDYLLVAIVTEVVGTAITEGLEVIDSVHLDMSQLRVAGRVDVTAWQQGADRYISFLKARGDIAHYFKLFLGCNDLVLALEESKKLVAGLEQFTTERELEPAQRDEFLEKAHDYLNNLGKDVPVSLEALSNHLWPDAPEELQLKLGSEELGLSDGFVPDRRAIRGLVKFEGKSDYWKLTFDRKAVRSGHLRYNRETDSIVLTHIPDQLRQELIDEIDG